MFAHIPHELIRHRRAGGPDDAASHPGDTPAAGRDPGSGRAVLRLPAPPERGSIPALRRRVAGSPPAWCHAPSNMMVVRTFARAMREAGDEEMPSETLIRALLASSRNDEVTCDIILAVRRHLLGGGAGARPT